MENQVKNVQEAQNEVVNEVMNEVTNEKTICTIQTIKTFDENICLMLDKDIKHINEHGEEVNEPYVSISRNKALNLLSDYIFTIGVIYPDVVYNLLLGNKIEVTRKAVKKGETINDYTYTEDGFYYEIVLKEYKSTKMKDILISEMTKKAMNGDFQPQKKEIQIPKFA